jgi:hypothetical protein
LTNDNEERSSSRLRRNFIAFTILMAILVAVHFVILLNLSALRSTAQAAVFGWGWLGIVAAVGALGTLCVSYTPLPGLWDSNLGFRTKLLWPLLIGLALGVAMVVWDRSTGWSHLMAQRMHLPSIHIAWPLSVPIYFGGAILVTILYYFLLIPLIHWLVAGRILKNSGEAIVYWSLALPLSLVEPLTQGDFHDIAQSGPAAIPNAVGDVLLNLLQVWFLRRAGLVSAIAVRVGFYAIWHVAYGLLEGIRA